MSDILTGFNTTSVDILTFPGIMKILFIVIIAGYILYSFLLTLRVRILADSVVTPSNSFARMVSYSHLLVSLLGGLLVLILILLG